jgi:capsule polysaccharide export protein KpsE/RkpR
MSRLAPAAALLAAMGLVTACASQQAAAERAVAAAESALTAIQDEAKRWMPGDLASVEAALVGVKEKLTARDFTGAAADAQALAARIATLAQAVETKQQAIAAGEAAWQAYEKDLPAKVERLRARIAELQGSLKLPANLPQEAFAAAADRVEDMAAEWAETTSAWAAGNADDALARAKRIEDGGVEAARLLGLDGQEGT